MAEKAKAPTIRFKGFTDAWEQRKITELGKIFIGLVTTMTKNYTDEGTLLIRNSDIKDNRFEFGKYPIHLESLFAEKNSTRMHLLGDVITVHTGDVGTSAVITEKELNSIGFATIVTRPNPKLVDSKYLSCFLNTDLHKKWAVSVSTGDGRTNYNLGDYNKLVVPVPDLNEQTKIAQFIDQLSNLITLHQRKLSKLKNVKKAMLEKMFPKNGSNVPEIRFAGFTDAWEQRKLGALVQFSKGSGYSKSDLKETGTPIILYGRLYTNYETVISNVDTFVDAKPGSVYSRGGEVIVPASGETSEDISIASVVEKPGVLLGGDLNVITPAQSIDSAFLAISISYGKPHEDMAKVAQGKSIVHLHNSDLEKIELLYPRHDEQLRISDYFRELDNLITLHQRKLEKLKNVKKACLEKMFV